MIDAATGSVAVQQQWINAGCLVVLSNSDAVEAMFDGLPILIDHQR